jgi:hypothetical protein
MIDRYLEPLMCEVLLDQEDINMLFGHAQDILDFQRTFYKNLDQAVSPKIHSFVDIQEFKVNKKIFKTIAIKSVCIHFSF